ncbi:MAG: glycine cleavage system protein GcvH [Actinomycetota bacterium]|nr:glycine cleavage system protein GcvH [Actinomycetota bacterium]MDD5667283.1 glycine cleavage system protein GcvH [Actinomycetota bacterium]
MYPEDLKYHAEHCWARIDGNMATLGITYYAQDQLGEIVFLELPETGTEVGAGKPYAEIESVKSVSDVYSPVNGTIVETNKEVVEAPEIINEDCYEAGWMVKVELAEDSGVEDLLDAAAYEKLVAES